MAWLPLPAFGQAGLNLDGQPEDLPAGTGTAGSNMRYRAGYAERMRGFLTVYNTPSITPYSIAHYTVGTTRNVVYAGLVSTYADDGTTKTDITETNNTGGIDDRWTPIVFNGVYIQNNGVDVPQYWGGNTANNLANLTAWPANHTVRAICGFANKIVTGDVTRGGVRERSTVLWSHTADPGTIPDSWDITNATKDAGDVSLSETNGTIIDMKPLGDVLMIYKDDAIHFAQSVQSSAIFRFGRIPSSVGLLARGCVVDTPIGHVFVTPGFDIVTHQQGNPQSILDGRMRTWLKSTINATYAARSFLTFNVATNEVLYCFPSGSATTCDKALVWSWVDNTFAIRDLSNVTAGSCGQVTLADSNTWAASTDTWATIAGTWGTTDYAPNSPRLILTRTTPALAMYDASDKDYGSNFTATHESIGMAFDAPHRVKLMRAVRPNIDAAAGTVIYIQFGAAMLPDQQPTWQDPVTFTVGADIEAHSFASGRFLALRMYSTANQAWRTKQPLVDVVPQGLY